ncbi:hypothetical protein [Streptomyces hokutonensis]|uniref:hypothetical protein n=1 Tax=Streptomyces hokutonensis TaxID=1306990 RepID=UPI0036A5DBC2
MDEQDSLNLADDPTFVLLKVEEAAHRLRIGRTKCFALISSGALESVMIDGLRRVPVDAIPEYVTRLRTANHTAQRVA